MCRIEQGMPASLQKACMASDGARQASSGLHCAKKKAVDESTAFLFLAERAGFEPAVGISPHTLSRRAT